MNTKGQDQDSQSIRALHTLSLAAGLGIIFMIIYAFQAATRPEFFSVIGIALVIAGAALLLGGLLGFLFGIPRTLQHENSTNTPASNEDTAVDYQANTNLEQISDWLTKMLVGVGLTQLTSMPDYLGKASAVLGVALGNRPGDPTFALAMVLYYILVGFLFGYLWTRLFLAGAFRQADLRAIGALASRVEQTDRKINEFKKQSELDVEALNLTYRHLNPSPDMEAVTQEQLDQAIAAASRPIRVQIFNQAWSIRGDNWRANKGVMERTIPVFRALIAADPQDRYHMNHGQLGFALKDQSVPDWQEAEKELSTAILIRGPWQEKNWLFYEFNRAICRIMLDNAFARGEAADATTRAAIVADLGAAWQSDLRKLLQKDALLKDWMNLNKVQTAELRSAE